MNKGARGKKNGHAGRGGVERCWPRTSRASFNRQERAIERHLRQKARKLIQEQVAEKEEKCSG